MASAEHPQVSVRTYQPGRAKLGGHYRLCLGSEMVVQFGLMWVYLRFIRIRVYAG